jgi:hypothetical protein
VNLASARPRHDPHIAYIVAILAIGTSLTDGNDGAAREDVQLCSTDGARIRRLRTRKE